MGKHHFFVAASDVQDGYVEIKGDEAHHAARVLRVRGGEEISVADGSGRVLEAVVTDVGSVVRAEVHKERVAAPALPQLTLCQAVAKGDRMDEVVEKAVEVGVSRIVPFIGERTVVRWDGSRRAKAHKRWAAIARAAAKQSRSPWLTIVEGVEETAAAAAGDEGPVVVLHEAAERRLRDALPPTTPQSLTLVVGPEGGLSDREVEALTASGASATTLGERILRTSTAGLAAAVVVAYHYGSLG